MKAYSRGPLAIGILRVSSLTAFAQPLSQAICTAAASYFGSAGVMQPQQRSLPADGFAQSLSARAHAFLRCLTSSRFNGKW